MHLRCNQSFNVVDHFLIVITLDVHIMSDCCCCCCNNSLTMSLRSQLASQSAYALRVWQLLLLIPTVAAGFAMSKWICGFRGFIRHVVSIQQNEINEYAMNVCGKVIFPGLVHKRDSCQINKLHIYVWEYQMLLFWGSRL